MSMSMNMNMRRTLPLRRGNETFELVHNGTRVAVTVGRYPDGSIGEVFLNCAKVGSSMEAMGRDAAVLLSIAIQHRVPIDILRHAITRESNGRPSTFVGAVIDKLEQWP
jgi:hypothetical protein